MSPNFTMASRGAASKPASTASARVTVKSAAGSKFIFKLSSGDFVVDLGAVLKFVSSSIVPNGMPKELTFEATFVISRPALNGLERDTETWLTLFSFPVDGKTRAIYEMEYKKKVA